MSLQEVVCCDDVCADYIDHLWLAVEEVIIGAASRWTVWMKWARQWLKLVKYNFFCICLFRSHRHVVVRAATARLICHLTELLGADEVLSGAKDLTDRILSTCSQFVLDSSPDVRFVTSINTFKFLELRIDSLFCSILVVAVYRKLILTN